MTTALESLRPTSLDEVIGQTEAITMLSALVEKSRTGGSFPHLLLYGAPGTGKTSAAIATVRGLFGDAWKDGVREINASDERGISLVRDNLKTWVYQAPASGLPFKVLMLEEADQLTEDAQAAMRRIMESGAGTTRFILTVNAIGRIIPAIRSRCAMASFRPLSDEHLAQIVCNAARKEKLPINDERVKTSVEHSHGDARRAISLYLDGGADSERYEHLDMEIIRVFNGPGESGKRIESFIKYLREDGWAEYEDVLEAVANKAVQGEIVKESARRQKLMVELGMTAFRSTQVLNPLFQIRSMLYSVVP